jgi:calpain-15
LFAGGRITAKNIEQGQIGNCYFVAAVCALATKSGLLEDLFLTKEVNEAGVYAMRFYLNGQERVVVVDDFLPIDPKFDNSWNTLNPAFARSKERGEFWMCLLEKAWAKLHGSYGAIVSGTSNLVFLHLTKKPTHYIHHRDEDQPGTVGEEKRLDREGLW